MNYWTPLRLTTPLRHHVFGGRNIAERLGRRGLPDWTVAETWEVSDVEGSGATVREGSFAGKRLRELTLTHPEELVGWGWRGDFFPLLTKFIDGAGMLPVHLHADDETARRLEGQPNGKTEAWHVLWAAPGATCLLGVKPGVEKAALRAALLAGDFDTVMNRVPVRAGDTIHVPGGTLHSFGGGTLIYEIEQTSNIQQHAMPWRMEDGSQVPREEQEKNIDMLLQEIHLESRPLPELEQRVERTEHVDRVLCCTGRHFTLERWRVFRPWTYQFDGARILSNVGGPVTLRAGDWTGLLPAGESLLLPAVLGSIEIQGLADVLVGYLPQST
jgi:mannose-6-phosphate isomerase